MSITSKSHFYSIVIAVHPSEDSAEAGSQTDDWRLGEINVDWVDFTREKSVDRDSDMAPDSQPPSTSESPSTSGRRKGATQRSVPGSSSGHSPTPAAERRKRAPAASDPDSLSLQPLLAHFPGPNPLDSSVAQGVSSVGRGVVHLFRHAPPAHLIASLDSHPVGEGSGSTTRAVAGGSKDEWSGDRAEGEDGSLIAILAVPAWMRPADFLEFIGGWGTCLEGVRMIREATTPNRSIVLLKFRDPLQASDFLVIYTGRAFSTLDSRETCHPIRIHHLVLHKLDTVIKPKSKSAIAVPAFPPSVYASRVKALPDLLTGVPGPSKFELPSCPVCLERLDSTVTGLVTLPCAHTFDCDCLKKWGDSRCPVCRVSHLLLSSAQNQPTSPGQGHRGGQITRATKCVACDSTENNWICVVCGVVGCGRYNPGKGHARRHWEESGHVLAMELETQRVWDYKGDNYVHRLIQTRNDGKLVELPSASSLVTSLARPLPLNDQPHTPRERTNGTATNEPSPTRGNHSSPPAEAGPSSNDIDKMSTIEAITLEYSYLLSSQLEAMRQHYETQQSDLQTRLEGLEAQMGDIHRITSLLDVAQRDRDKAERKAKQATDLSRSLQSALSAERAMSQGLSERIKVLENDKGKRDAEKQELEQEKAGLEETVKDLMFSLEAGMKIQQLGGDGGEGGDLVIKGGGEKPAKAKKGKK